MTRIIAGVARRIRRNLLGPMPDDPARLAPQHTPLSIDLSRRVALVTGATGEIGRCITRTLAGCGAKTAIHYYRSGEAALTLCNELRAAGAEACVVFGDIADIKAVEAMREQIEANLGPVDIVVNNAVTWFAEGPVVDQDADQFDRVFRSSVLQAWATARVFSQPMKDQNWGRIISLGTEVTSQALINRAPYTAAKCAMDGMMRSLARELGEHGITVNQVAPGWMITDRDRRDRDEVQPDYERGVALKRRGYDQDVANLTAFLASDLAGFITGVRVPVCGGNIMPEA
ncbi:MULTISPECIES: SDR family oxidoreductase [Rhodopseudomonas]|uniref:SDR family NAD(P)-dependent oxidoreductase n=1 Tax=Rhodopseudomonas TaxID=1073 RepID=UPI00191C5442|nr:MULTISPECIES: SDR family oxidoreductase [Rhodopseudomonas]MDF3811252.1 SDR family oxidoreductase [Rhodopseudomonas sp. BAL398]WOK18577.1 SDR family oxidoreductase [Rhodopseudomonas sp. BAL398]